jgi:hypothetical protein
MYATPQTPGFKAEAVDSFQLEPLSEVWIVLVGH